MSWLDTLGAELRVRGVPSSDRRRILIELGDHLDCDPGCEDRLGDPRDLAVTFAEELATSRARGCAFSAVGALALAAVALVASQLVIAGAVGYPGSGRGISIALFIPALLGMVFAAQVALVAGLLSAWRAGRGRRAMRLPGAEVALIMDRTRVALFGGVGAMAGLGLYLADFSPIVPGWYLALFAGLASAAALGLVLSLRGLRRAAGIVSKSPGPAGDVYDDLARVGCNRLRRRPWLLGVVGSLLVAIVAILLTGHAEHSLIEGLERGIPEGLAAALGFAVLGRTIGLRPARVPPAHASGGLAPAAVTEPITEDDERLAADADRSRAELILRESFAHGRLDLDELTRRVGEVHQAQTVAQVRAALRGLPPGR